MSVPEIIALGENAFVIRISHRLDRDANSKARIIADAIEAAGLRGVTDVVPANSSVGVYFSDDRYSSEVRTALHAITERQVESLSRTPDRTHEISVMYDGPDLLTVAGASGLSVREVVDIHSSREYQVFAIGFAPGFAYMGELDERISVPRRAEPRTKVAAGSVAIANRQTAIYPFDTPGGWNLIGTTSVRAFDVRRKPPALFEVGDTVRFVAI